nr:hypothetical protein [Tanacetum cinerariifolium]
DVYEPRVCYDENDGIYAKAVIFVNKRLVRLMDVTVKQWLDLIYGDHRKVDVNVKEGVISKWNEKTKWPTCNLNDEGLCNGGELPRMVRVGYMTYFQDYKWYDDLVDGKLKGEALKQKAIYEGS